MKKFPLVFAVAALSLTALTANSGVAASQGCPMRPTQRHEALLSIPRLGMRNQPVATVPITADQERFLATGPIWDQDWDTDWVTGKPIRPGSGRTMVINAHDVTKVPCYGEHGPFNHLYEMKRGDRVKIKWNGEWRTYRVATRPKAWRQCASKKVNDSYEHLVLNSVMCAPYRKPVRTNWKVETIYLRCCWPAGTRRKYLYVRASLVRTRPA